MTKNIEKNIGKPSVNLPTLFSGAPRNRLKAVVCSTNLDLQAKKKMPVIINTMPCFLSPCRISSKKFFIKIEPLGKRMFQRYHLQGFPRHTLSTNPQNWYYWK
jgi:hypothetical protein